MTGNWVVLNMITNAGGAGRRFPNLFPDREFIMRSQGQVRFVTLSSRVQIGIAAALLLALLVLLGSLGVMLSSQNRAEADRSLLLSRAAAAEDARETVDAYRDDIDAVASDLAKRQKFIEEMVERLPADLKADGESPAGEGAEQAGDAARTAAKISAILPEATMLARIEARQIDFADRLTAYADRRSERATVAIRQLGLDPDAILRGEQRTAMGGPLESADLDPRFEKLGLSVARMAALERGLQSIPQAMPASMDAISSGFGFRSDPFSGSGAMHSGLDFRGPTGAPIYAAANGRISFIGMKSGYGKVVEITHGNGLMTRYAHMSRFNARPGQTVEAGEIIGAIGSTGRSTGPHLHFEVRIHGRAVNPRPFLEAAPDVLEKARGA